jgi:methionyl-tRNA formyltransferase
LLVATLDGIADGSLVAEPQAADGGSLAPKLTVDDARIEWSAPAMRVDRVVRACTPAPGAWTTFRGERLKVRPVELRRGVIELSPGQLEVNRDGVLVGTGTHAVRLGEVQPQGKRPMAAADWARGVRIEAGERLGQ